MNSEPVNPYPKKNSSPEFVSLPKQVQNFNSNSKKVSGPKFNSHPRQWKKVVKPNPEKVSALEFDSHIRQLTDKFTNPS